MGTKSLRPTKRVHRSENEFKDLKKSWNKLVDTAGADVFQLHEWQYSWWNIFGTNNELQIVTYWLDDELIAVLPFFIQGKKISRFRFIKTLQLIGSHVTTANGGILPVDKAFAGYLDIIVNPDHISVIKDGITELFRELINYVDEIVLDEVPEHSVLLHCISEIETFGVGRIKQSNASFCSHCLIDSDWDAYLSTLSRSTRKHIRRGLRSIYDDHLFEIRQAENIEEFEKTFRTLVQLHQERWHRLDQPGIFADQRLKEFYHETSLHLFESGAARLYWAEKDGDILAVELIYTFNNTIYAVQNGFDDTSDYSKFSPSNLILYHVMKTGIEQGYLVFDWLRGTECYKSSTTTLVLKNKRITISSGSLLSKTRIFLTKHAADFLTKSKNELQILAVYHDNYGFWEAKKRYTKRMIKQLPSGSG